VEALPDEAKAELALDDDHRTRVIDERELTVADWRLSWKLWRDSALCHLKHHDDWLQIRIEARGAG
jgi:hypothetical protein